MGVTQSSSFSPPIASAASNKAEATSDGSHADTPLYGETSGLGHFKQLLA